MVYKKLKNPVKQCIVALVIGCWLQFTFFVFEKSDEYMNNTCDLSYYELNKQRSENSPAFNDVLQTLFLNQSCFNKTSYNESVSSVMIKDGVVKLDFGFGTYRGIQDIVEYLAVASVAMNGKIYDQRLVGTSKIMTSKNKINVNAWSDPIFFQVQKHAPIYLEHEITFKECNPLIESFHIVDQSRFFPGQHTGIWMLTKPVYTYMKYFGNERTCKIHQLYCTGEYQQFHTFQECYGFPKCRTCIQSKMWHWCKYG
jgi:hypothetical protein